MMILATFSYLQSYSAGGMDRWKEEDKIFVGETEDSVKEQIEEEMKNHFNKLGQRKLIRLVDIKRI